MFLLFSQFQYLVPERHYRLTDISLVIFQRHALHTFASALMKVTPYSRQNSCRVLFKTGQMGRQDRATQTNRQQHRYGNACRLAMKALLKLISSLVLPLMLGIFTVVITFHQQRTAREQRLEDRLDDRHKSQEQRKQELDIANMGRETQMKATNNQYQDEVLVAYIKEIADSLEKSNGSIMSDSIMATIARAKTLNTIRQLDGTRNSHVIRFLYEARQLTTTKQSSALDISTVQLVNIDKSILKTVSDIGTLSLVGALLRNCTINHTSLRDIDFSSTEIDDSDFTSSELDSVQIQFGRLKNVNFTYSTFRYAMLHLSFQT